MFGKVYFPRLAVPVSILISNLIAFAIQFVFFLAFMLYFCTSWNTFASELVDTVHSGAVADDGWFGTRLWHHCFLAYHQIP